MRIANDYIASALQLRDKRDGPKAVPSIINYASSL